MKEVVVSCCEIMGGGRSQFLLYINLRNIFREVSEIFRGFS